MHAMRVARAFTGREKIVKFEGQYHGVHDYALISVGPDDMSELGDADAPVALAWGRGIPGAVAETIIPARYNRIDRLRTLFEQRGEEIAAIIVEPVLGNAQGIMPKPGFHKEMRALTEEFGILLIFDEVKTGFRFAKGGAAEFFGIKPGPRARSPRRWATAIRRPRSAGATRSWRCCPTRSATAARTPATGSPRRPRSRRSQILRDTNALETIHATGRTIQDGLREILEPDRHPVPLHGPPVDVRDHVPRGGRDRVPRLGDDRPRAVRRDRHRHARPRRDARAGLARAVVHVRGARRRATSSTAS